MTQQTFTDNVVIDGSRDITQLTVEGHSTQTQALQTWQDSAQTPAAKLTGDGRLQVGDFEPAGTMATDDALIEAHRSDTSTKPKRGLHTLGRISGALSEAITWAVQELELLGSGGVSSLQTALRARIAHKNTGTSTTAELRAGDFEATNETGTSGAPVGKATGIRAAVRNLTGAFLQQAVGAEISLENTGTITDAYGLQIGDIQQGANRNYSVHAGSGTAHFGDDLELLVQPNTPSENPPPGFVKLYPKEVAGIPHLYSKDATGAEREVSTSGSPVTGRDLFAQTANVTVANTTTESTLLGSGQGSLILPANWATAGRTLELHAAGYHSTLSSSPGTLRFRIKLGNTIVVTSGAINLPLNLSGVTWWVDARLTFRANGVSGSIIGQVEFGLYSTNDIGSATKTLIKHTITTPVTIDTTVALPVNLTAQYSVASTSNTITCTNAIIGFHEPTGDPLTNRDLFAQTANVTVANTTTESTLLGSGQGSLILPANWATAGRTLELHTAGYHSTLSSSPGTLRFRIKLGNTIVVTSGAINLPLNLSGVTWWVDARLTFRANGVSGSIIGQVEFGLYSTNDIGSATKTLIKHTITTPVTIDTTVALPVNLTAQYSVASTSNTIICTNAIIGFHEPSL
jgi:hypothetical protein